LVGPVHPFISSTESFKRVSLSDVQGLIKREGSSHCQFAQESIEKKKLEEEKEDHQTIVGNIMRARDIETGAKLSDRDLLPNASIFVYNLMSLSISLLETLPLIQVLPH
jgi:hypothetical protein